MLFVFSDDRVTTLTLRRLKLFNFKREKLTRLLTILLARSRKLRAQYNSCRNMSQLDLTAGLVDLDGRKKKISIC